MKKCPMFRLGHLTTEGLFLLLRTLQSVLEATVGSQFFYLLL